MPETVEQTWTFCGHWEEDRIVIDYVLPGRVPDERIDTGRWSQGLWAASGAGTDMHAAMAATIAEYEGGSGEYEFVYTEHLTDDGDNCGYSGQPVESGAVDTSDPDAADDGHTCPNDCRDGAIERSDATDE